MSAWVFGASGGIGSACVARLRDRGVHVTGFDRYGEESELSDVTTFLDEDSVCELVRGWRERLGVPEVVVWSVGTYSMRPLGNYDSMAMTDVLLVNLTSFMAMCKHVVLPAMAKGPVRLVAVTSQAAVHGGTDPVYAASKAGVIACVKSLAREHAAGGLRANAVAPGPTNTPMADVMGHRREYYEALIPIGRFNEPDEVAACVEWLSLDAPDSVTGMTLDVDGGLVRR